jgi:hypothetical protein
LSIAAGHGITNALEGNYQLLSSPIQSVKALVEALRNPKQTASAVAEGLRGAGRSPEAFTEFAAEMLTPGPGLRGKKAPPKQDIVIPETIWTDADRLRESWRGPDGLQRVEADPIIWYLDAPENSYHPTLRENLARGHKGNPSILYRDLPDEQYGVYYPSINRIAVNTSLDDYSKRNTLTHEMQHAIQENAGLSEQFKGANLSEASSWGKYAANPGEIEARIAALRDAATPSRRREIPFVQDYQTALLRAVQKGDRWEPESLSEFYDWGRK